MISQADHIPQGQRASAFGILSGVSTGASFVCGTLATRFLSTTSTFQVATLFEIYTYGLYFVDLVM